MSKLTRSVPVALVAGVAGVAGSYAVAGTTPAFVAAPVSDVVVATTPDLVVRYAILLLGGLGHFLGFMLALALTAGLLGVGAFVGIVVGDRLGSPRASGLAALGFGWLLAVGLTGDVAAGVGAALPLATVVVVADAWALTGDGDVAPGRRRVLKLAGAVVGFAGVAALVGQRTTGDDAEPLDESTDDDVQSLLDDAASKSLGVAGVPGLVSDVGEFYEVDIASVNPDIDREDWSLSVTGAVDSELSLSYDDVRGMGTEHRFVTLRCVGESLNGNLMDNALWTGIPVAPLLDRAGPRGGCECVMLRAADGYFEEFPLAALRRGFLAYGMNGQSLPRKHGAPVRALIPGHWGEINVKWLTEIEVLDREAKGYWERRGWHGTGPVNTVAKLWTVNRLDDGRVEVAGHAYAGTRGVDRVEVSIDGGASWTDARLSDPLPGEDVWRQWAYAFRPTGRHEVVVRAVDGTGAVQPETEADAFPNGASGWVRRTIRE